MLRNKSIFFITILLGTMLTTPMVGLAQVSKSDEARAYFFQAETAYEDGEYTKALEYLDEAESILGRSAPIFLALEVKSHWARNDVEATRAAIDRFYADPKASDQLKSELSGILIELKEKETAAREAAILEARITNEKADKAAAITDPVTNDELKAHLQKRVSKGRNGRSYECCRDRGSSRGHGGNGDKGYDARRAITLLIQQTATFSELKPVGTLFAVQQASTTELGQWDFSRTLQIINRGGDGGNGGTGSEGYRGEPAQDAYYSNGFKLRSEKRGTKGANGGDGGDGGQGGKGGDVTVYIIGDDAFFKDVSSALNIDARGGSGGRGGKGGRGGRGGEGTRWVAGGSSGRTGDDGRTGKRGADGTVSVLRGDANTYTKLVLEPRAKAEREARLRAEREAAERAEKARLAAEAAERERQRNVEMSMLNAYDARIDLPALQAAVTARGANGRTMQSKNIPATHGKPGGTRYVLFEMERDFKLVPDVYAVTVFDENSREIARGLMRSDQKLSVDVRGGLGGNAILKKRRLRDLVGKGAPGGNGGKLYTYFHESIRQRPSKSGWTSRPIKRGGVEWATNWQFEGLAPISFIEATVSGGAGGANTGKFAKDLGPLTSPGKDGTLSASILGEVTFRALKRGLVSYDLGKGSEEPIEVLSLDDLNIHSPAIADIFGRSGTCDSSFSVAETRRASQILIQCTDQLFYRAAYDAIANALFAPSFIGQTVSHPFRFTANASATSIALYRAGCMEGVAQSCNSEAWTLATSSDLRERDSKRAVEAAQRAMELSPDKLAMIRDTLAAAYAEDGQFEKAVEEQSAANEAARLTGEPWVAEGEARLELYKLGKPYRQQP